MSLHTIRPRSIGLSSLSRDSHFKHNLKILNTPLKGNQVLVAKGKRLVIEEHGNFFARLSYNLSRKSNEQAVRTIITGFVKKLDFAEVDLTEKQESKLAKFVFNRLAPLSQTIFDRSQLQESLIFVLNPDQDKEEELAPQEKLNRKVEEVRFAQKLGVALKPTGGGVGGSYFAYDYKMNVMGVFKPKSQEALTGKKIQHFRDRMNRILFRVLGVKIKKSFNPSEGYLAEVMTAKTAEHLRFRTVPHSLVARFELPQAKKGKLEKGSFQEFIPDTESAMHAFKMKSDPSIPVLGRLKAKLHFSKHPQAHAFIRRRQFEELAALDFIIFNYDRHYENILVNKEASKGKRDLFLIDNQLAFPKRNPKGREWLLRTNQFKWAVLPQAKRRFSAKMEARLRKRLTNQGVEALIAELREVYNKEGKNFDDSQEEALRIRVAVLLKALDSKLTLRSLSKINTQAAMTAFLEKD